MTIDDSSRPFRRGINFGNTLDIAREVESPWRLEDRYFDLVRDAGFDTVRLPVQWSAWADQSVPYRIDRTFVDRVDRAVEGALRRDLTVVLDFHHYDELQRNPSEHEARFITLWEQIATRYADQPQELYFELLNEPRDAMTAHRWNRLLARVLEVVRAANPNRTVIVGPDRMNDLHALPDLELPADDHLIVTIHYYAPMEFTHQGTQWTPGADRWLGTTWGSPFDRDAVREDLTQATTWARQQGRQLFIGEFGTYDQADLASRRRWTRWVRFQAEQLGLSWCYWDFSTDFGLFDLGRNTWREPLYQALFNPLATQVTDSSSSAYDRKS